MTPAALGTVTIRTRHKRGGVRRAWVKVAQPNVWKLRAQVVWEASNGPLPPGMGVHHKDEDTLNDVLANLEATTKAEHLAAHRDGFDEAKRIASFTETRRAQRWSTKSKIGKRVGAPPTWSDEQLNVALAAIRSGMSPNSAAKRFGIARTTLYRRSK